MISHIKGIVYSRMNRSGLMVMPFIIIDYMWFKYIWLFKEPKWLINKISTIFTTSMYYIWSYFQASVSVFHINLYFWPPNISLLARTIS